MKPLTLEAVDSYKDVSPSVLHTLPLKAEGWIKAYEFYVQDGVFFVDKTAEVHTEEHPGLINVAREVDGIRIYLNPTSAYRLRERVRYIHHPKPAQVYSNNAQEMEFLLKGCYPCLVL